MSLSRFIETSVVHTFEIDGRPEYEATAEWAVRGEGPCWLLRVFRARDRGPDDLVGAAVLTGEANAYAIREKLRELIETLDCARRAEAPRVEKVRSLPMCDI